MKVSNLKYLFYKSNRKQLTIVSSMVANTALGVAQIVLSMVKLSLFLGFSGAFYIVLALGKFYALERLLRLKSIDEKIKNGAEVKSIDKINNCTLIAAALFFSFGIVITFFYEDPSNYSFGMILFIAASALYKVLSYFISIFAYWRKKSGVKYYVKMMGAAAALISLALTQRAILYYLNIPNVSIYSGIGGMVFSLMATLIAFYMVKKASAQKKYLIENDMIDEKTKTEIQEKQAKRKKFAEKIVTSIKKIFGGKK